MLNCFVSIDTDPIIKLHLGPVFIIVIDVSFATRGDLLVTWIMRFTLNHMTRFLDLIAIALAIPFIGLFMLGSFGIMVVCQLRESVGYE